MSLGHILPTSFTYKQGPFFISARFIFKETELISYLTFILPTYFNTRHAKLGPFGLQGTCQLTFACRLMATFVTAADRQAAQMQHKFADVSGAWLTDRLGSVGKISHALFSDSTNPYTLNFFFFSFSFLSSSSHWNKNVFWHRPSCSNTHTKAPLG